MLQERMTDYLDCVACNRGGFNFDNNLRNELLISSGKVSLPPMKKTGTTICGVVCKDAVVLSADTRATAGSIVADKNCSKLHRIAANIYCAGAGTSADLCHTTLWLGSCVELHRLNTNTAPRVSHVVSIASQELFKYMGYKQCALVLGGVDVTGPHLYKIYPHGSTDKSPFAAMGSGSLCAMAVLERGFKDGMTVEEGKKLVVDAIRAGIFNDLGSGGNVDVCVMTKDGAKHERGYVEPNVRMFRKPQPTVFTKGTTPCLREKTREIKSKSATDASSRNRRNNDDDVDMAE